MKTIIFATSNQNKVIELEYLVKDLFHIESLETIGFDEEVPETTGTIHGNAIQKAEYVYKKIGKPCVAEDTGLEVDALAGAPGVDTSMYAGAQRNAIDNMNLLLQNLKGKSSRNGQFRTVVAWCDENGTRTFEGIVRGTIAQAIEGDKGFGYDPIFVPEGYEDSFAKLGNEVKSKISHRSRAFTQFLAFIKNI